MDKISKNFRYSEFEYSDTAKKHGIDNTLPEDLRPNVKALVDNVLQPLRDVWGVMKINSGYRCKRLNELVGGVETSQHASAEAADVACSNPLGLAQLAKDMDLPFDQIGLYPTFVHISHKKNGKQRGHIFYNKSYKGAKLK
jgi:uncharacterized protein YcbK (DUF882 family)